MATVIRNHRTLAVAVGLALAAVAPAREPVAVPDLVGRYCAGCHGSEDPKAGLDLAAAASEPVARHPLTWEKVVRRLRAGQMPPAGHKRPDEATYASVLADLESVLDKAAAEHPSPGRTDALRRLTRTEYQNAVRDLLAVDVDAAALLPADEASHGFDNVTVRELSPTLLDRYITAAEKIARLAVGTAERAPGGATIRVRPDITQEDRMNGLPVGTRGGTRIHYTFPRDGEYEVRVRLARDRNEQVEGLRGSHEMEVLLDRERVQSFTVKPPPAGQGHERVDAHLTARLSVTAGPHDLGVTFLKEPADLQETLRQPYQAHFNMHRHPRLSPAVYQVTITGPFNDKGPGDTPSRRRLFVARPKSPADEEACTRKVLATVMRRAYRRPVGDADVERVLPFYREARRGADFDAGIEAALSAILVSREFLFRIERDPAGLKPGEVYRAGDLDLASRLSFFLWSSIPDDELLALAERGELHKPDVLSRQTRRMLADPKARSLVTNFAEQWLHLRNLEAITPDPRLFPDFDDNLRQSMRRETEHLFEEVVRDDRSVLDLLKADHTWLDERLAKHYGIPYLYGPRARRVTVAGVSDPGRAQAGVSDPGYSRRGGLLRQASVLSVTSYATRTSPVIRGKWVLENLVGTPPPPPLPNVPALDNTVTAGLPVRERLAEHRKNAVCASCHNFMDPVGFALENYDAVGRWRATEAGRPVDASGGLPDGRRFTGVAGLEAGLLDRPYVFVGTLTEKLLTFALGRGIEPADGPAVRRVVRAARGKGYRFSAIIESIVQSDPFVMRAGP